MTLKQISYFQAVCEKGNISSAAEDLFVARSVISRAIADLEDEFGGELFVRSKNGVVLTDSGRIVAKLFSGFTACYNTTRARIHQLHQGALARPLRLGVTPTNAYGVYRTYLDGFQHLHPEITFRVEEHSAFDAWKLLLDGELDAFFTPARPDSAFFQCLELYQNPIMLGAAEKTPIAQKGSISIGDILDLPLAFFNAPMPIEAILNACFQTLGKTPNVVLRTSDQLLLQELTMQGQIYPILPLDMMGTWQNIRQIPLDFFHPTNNRMVWVGALSHNREMEVFLQYMEKQII